MGHVTVSSSKGFANTLFVDFSAGTESLRLVWFMGHDTVCTSKGFDYSIGKFLCSYRATQLSRDYGAC